MKMIDFLNDYVILLVLGICLCIGYVIKTSIPKLDNKYIPLIMAVLGVVLNVWINMSFSPTILLGGLFSGLSSTGLHQAFKQMIDNKEQ